MGKKVSFEDIRLKLSIILLHVHIDLSMQIVNDLAKSYSYIQPSNSLWKDDLMFKPRETVIFNSLKRPKEKTHLHITNQGFL